MEFSLLIFLTFIFSFSKAEVMGEWNMSHPIYHLTGESFHLLYTTTDDIIKCIFVIPNANNSEDIDVILGNHKTGTSKNRPSEWTWNWYGEDSKKDCGIQINNASMADRGVWQVITEPYERDTENVYIFEHIAPNRIGLNRNTIHPYRIEPGSRPILVRVQCKAYKTRGKVTFTWWIGDNLLSGNVTNYSITNNTDEDNSLEYNMYKDVSQEFRYYPVPSHDGKQLKCIANHSKYTKENLANKTNIAAVNITVEAPPVPHEKDIVFKNHPKGDQSIKIQFHANPPPKDISWDMHDTNHPILGIESSGRYTTLALKSTGKRDYIATIRVSNLSESDGGQQNILMVKNEMGNTSYTFTFKFDEDAVKVAGLSVGAIVGIVLGCLGAVCLIWLVVSQVRKKRKSKKITQEGVAENRDEMRETSRTQHQDD